MRAANSNSLLSPDQNVVNSTKLRRAVYDLEPSVFADIYLEENNIAIWQRELTETLTSSVKHFLISNPTFQAAMTVTPESVASSLDDIFAGNADLCELKENVAELVAMFCCLFELNRVGLRLTALDRAMCPKFHVDRVPCRLVTTYQGVATEWLPHDKVNREKLGTGSQGKTDSLSGLYASQLDIQQLGCGDVALLKGELWEGNESAGLVHRSPAVRQGQNRLLLSLDFIS